MIGSRLWSAEGRGGQESLDGSAMMYAMAEDLISVHGTEQEQVSRGEGKQQRVAAGSR